MRFWLKYIFLKIFFGSSRLTLEYDLFVKLNKERKKRGIPKLFFQPDLQKVARKHSKDMAKNDYFDHTNLVNESPSDRFKTARVSEVVSGENLAKVRGYKNSVSVAHTGLMNSPGHKANILHKAYNCVGIGLAVSVDKTYYFTQNFSYRKIFVYKSPNVLRFSDVGKVKFKLLDPSVKSVLLRVFDRFEKVCFEQIVDVRDVRNSSLNFRVNKNGKYVCKIFVCSKGESGFRLTNEFEFQKKSLLW